MPGRPRVPVSLGSEYVNVRARGTGSATSASSTVVLQCRQRHTPATLARATKISTMRISTKRAVERAGVVAITTGAGEGGAGGVIAALVATGSGTGCTGLTAE